jgi:hypothetical protein
VQRQNLDLLNQNLNALFVEKSADSTEIDFVAKCVAIKELPEELVSQQGIHSFPGLYGRLQKMFPNPEPCKCGKMGQTPTSPRL